MRKTKPLELPCQLQSQPQQQPQSQAWQHVPAICPDYCLLLRLSLAHTSQPLQLALSSSSVSLMMPINLLSLLLQSIHRSKKESEPPSTFFLQRSFVSKKAGKKDPGNGNIESPPVWRWKKRITYWVQSFHRSEMRNSTWRCMHSRDDILFLLQSSASLSPSSYSCELQLL